LSATFRADDRAITVKIGSGSWRAAVRSYSRYGRRVTHARPWSGLDDGRTTRMLDPTAGLLARPGNVKWMAPDRTGGDAVVELTSDGTTIAVDADDDLTFPIGTALGQCFRLKGTSKSRVCR
jgi:hypothetical protein